MSERGESGKSSIGGSGAGSSVVFNNTTGINSSNPSVVLGGSTVASFTSSYSSSVVGDKPSVPHREDLINKKVDDYIHAAVSNAAAKVDELFQEKVAFMQQSEKKVSQMLEKSTQLVSTITKSLDSVNELTGKSVEMQLELKEEVKYIKGNAISALSIFVSFFAFITVAINVFSKAESVVSAILLVLIFWCLLIGFNVLISVQFKVFQNVKLVWFALGFVIFISVVSIVIMFYFSPEMQGVRYIFRFVT